MFLPCSLSFPILIQQILLHRTHINRCLFTPAPSVPDSFSTAPISPVPNTPDLITCYYPQLLLNVVPGAATKCRTTPVLTTRASTTSFHTTHALPTPTLLPPQHLLHQLLLHRIIHHLLKQRRPFQQRHLQPTPFSYFTSPQAPF
jgi:hypothetical protein